MRGDPGVVPSRLRLPANAWVVRPAFPFAEIPIFVIAEMLNMAVHERDIRPTGVKIGVDVILLGSRGELAVVEEPDGDGWVRN